MRNHLKSWNHGKNSDFKPQVAADHLSWGLMIDQWIWAFAGGPPGGFPWRFPLNEGYYCQVYPGHLRTLLYRVLKPWHWQRHHWVPWFSQRCTSMDSSGIFQPPFMTREFSATRDLAPNQKNHWSKLEARQPYSWFSWMFVPPYRKKRRLIHPSPYYY